MTAEVHGLLKRCSRFKWKQVALLLAFVGFISTDSVQGKPIENALVLNRASNSH